MFVLPRVFPHKNYSGASFDDRVEMLRAALAGERSILDCRVRRRAVHRHRAGMPGGLRRRTSGLSFLCGRDAAERIVGWDYGRPDACRRDAARFRPAGSGPGRTISRRPAKLAAAVRCLELDDSDGISATEVRDRIARGEPWEHLVPPLVTRPRIYQVLTASRRV